MDYSGPGNYRPITLGSICRKLLERIIESQSVGSKYLSVGFCKHNEHWGIIFEGTSTTGFSHLYGIHVSVHCGVETLDQWFLTFST